MAGVRFCKSEICEYPQMFVLLIDSRFLFKQQQQLHQGGLQGLHAHPPTIPLPHPGATPPQLPPGAASGLLALSNLSVQPPHLPMMKPEDKGMCTMGVSSLDLDAFTC